MFVLFITENGHRNLLFILAPTSLLLAAAAMAGSDATFRSADVTTGAAAPSSLSDGGEGV